MAGFTRWVSLVSEPATKLQRRHRYGAQVGFDFFTQAPVRLRQMQQAQGCGLVVGYLLPLAMVLRVGQLAQVEPFCMRVIKIHTKSPCKPHFTT